jgi:hypothetical protein
MCLAENLVWYYYLPAATGKTVSTKFPKPFREKNNAASYRRPLSPLCKQLAH